MDFSQFDSRTAAETSIPYTLRRQDDGVEILDGDTPCAVLVRGAASRSAQAELRQTQADLMRKAKDIKAAKSRGEATDEVKAQEDYHQQTKEAARRFITGFSGIQRKGDDGKLRDLTTSAEDIDWFLDLNFFSMTYLLRKVAVTKTEDETNAEFADRSAAYASLWHRPSFAQQILTVAEDDAGFLRAMSKG